VEVLPTPTHPLVMSENNQKNIDFFFFFFFETEKKFLSWAKIGNSDFPWENDFSAVFARLKNMPF
jgi:hypothetical protein